MTVLDKALKLAQVRKDKTIDFYRLFLRSKLVVPIMDLPVAGARIRPTTRGVFTFRVKLLRKRRVLMAFDSAERLKAAIKTPTQYVTLGTRALLKGLPADLYLLLNEGTSYAKMFLPKETAWLKQLLKPGPVKKAGPVKRV